MPKNKTHQDFIDKWQADRMQEDFAKNCPIGMIFASNADGRITYANPAFLGYLGYKEAELISKPFFNFLKKGELERTTKAFEQCQDDGFIDSFRNIYIGADGKEVHLRWHFSFNNEEEDLTIAICRKTNIDFFED
jgi:PAS domain S-box-containing protein